MDRTKDYKLSEFKVLIGDKLETITPAHVAEMFACMSSEEQSSFFNEVAKCASTWYGGEGALAIQMQYLTDDDGLNLSGRRVMQMIGEYSHWGLVPKADHEI